MSDLVTSQPSFRVVTVASAVIKSVNSIDFFGTFMKIFICSKV